MTLWRRLQLWLGVGPPMTGDEWLKTPQGRAAAAEAWKPVAEIINQSGEAVSTGWRQVLASQQRLISQLVWRLKLANHRIVVLERKNTNDTPSRSRG